MSALLVRGGALGGDPRSTPADGFTVTTTTLSPRTALPLHAHERANLNLVLSGGYTERVGAHSWVVPEGSCIVKPAGATHANRIADGAVQCVVIEVAPERLQSVTRHTALFEEVRLLRARSVQTFGFRILREIIAPDAVTALALPGLLLELIGETARVSTRGALGVEPRWLRDVHELLVAASRGAPVPTMAQIGIVAGHHPAYVARVFRRRHGMSMGDFVRAGRVQHAAHLLSRTAWSVSRIALELGYADQSHLARQFLRRVGVTPSTFRQLHGGDRKTGR